MTHLYPDMLKVNNRDDITRWWEVIDRTTGAVVSTSQWSYDETTGDVTIHEAGGVPQLHGQFSGIHYVGTGAYV